MLYVFGFNVNKNLSAFAKTARNAYFLATKNIDDIPISCNNCFREVGGKGTIVKNDDT
jgi:hypothetical protein